MVSTFLFLLLEDLGWDWESAKGGEDPVISNFFLGLKVWGKSSSSTFLPSSRHMKTQSGAITEMPASLAALNRVLMPRAVGCGA